MWLDRGFLLFIYFLCASWCSFLAAVNFVALAEQLFRAALLHCDPSDKGHREEWSCPFKSQKGLSGETAKGNTGNWWVDIRKKFLLWGKELCAGAVIYYLLNIGLKTSLTTCWTIRPRFDGMWVNSVAYSSQVVEVIESEGVGSSRKNTEREETEYERKLR